jgi:arylsulfatase/arylsulfatase A
MRVMIWSVIGLVAAGCHSPETNARARNATRPNVVLVMTDDQGIGDLGVMGNPVIETPQLDRFAAQSAQMTTFYVHPVCAPTRACLMTGRYNHRTRAIDTYVGRAMMDPGEVTLAEVLSKAGYGTGLFGKWHLGDNYPLRPQDQGFQEVLMHRGGGIGQPSDPPGGEGKYTDPVLFHNGVEKQFRGYCCDLYFDHAMRWMQREHEAGRPFFAYIPSNTPHGPFHDVPADLLVKYRKKDVAKIIVGKATGPEKDRVARIAAMVENIDQNMGRLVARLDAMGIAGNTIVIFMTDNGPNTRRYVTNLRGKKCEVHAGGIRTSFFLRWPARVKAGSKIDTMAAHIDVMPTLLAACGVAEPAGVKLDGRSFLPHLRGEKSGWDDDRALFIQSHRGNAPVPHHHVSVQTATWKLVNPSGFGREQPAGPPKWELYDIAKDPGESNDLASTTPDVVKRLTRRYDAWLKDVSATRPDNYAPPRILIGTKHENPSVLTRQDWRHVKGRPWGADSNGFWLLEAPEAGTYDVRVRFRSDGKSGRAVMTFGALKKETAFKASEPHFTFEGIRVPAGRARLQITMEPDGRGPWQVDVIRR